MYNTISFEFVLIMMSFSGLLLWIISMRRKIHRAEQFQKGIEALIRKGVVPDMDRTRFEQTKDGWCVSIEGRFGRDGKKYEVSFTTTKSGYIIPNFNLGKQNP